MGHYLLSVWHDEEYEVDFESDDMQRMFEQVGKFNEKLESADALVYANGLLPASSAKVARADGVSLTDGPFAETKEQMGGFWIIEAADDAEAHELAKQAAKACEGPVEVRAMQPDVSSD